MNDERASSTITALLHAAGLTISDEEAGQLAALYERFCTDRETLRNVNLGETEPTITFAPAIEVTPR